MSKVKLFCLPYAGGSAMSYMKWKKYLHDLLELHPVELTGRGKRLENPLYKTFEQAVDDVYCTIHNKLNDTDYALFGHSMGSWIVYELAHRIKLVNKKPPIHIFLSGRYPPHISRGNGIFHKLPDEEFKNKILAIGGTPKEVFENEELQRIFLPVLKADYEIVETYKHVHKADKLDVDFSVFGGRNDEYVVRSDLREWAYYTNRKCSFYDFDGGHFFIHENTEQVVATINSVIISAF